MSYWSPAMSSVDPRATWDLQEAPWTLKISRCHDQWVDCRMLIQHSWLHRQSEWCLSRTASKAVWVMTAKSSATTTAASLAAICWTAHSQKSNYAGVTPLRLTPLTAWALRVQKLRWSAADQTPASTRCPPPPRYHPDPELRRYSNAAPPSHAKTCREPVRPMSQAEHPGVQVQTSINVHCHNTCLMLIRLFDGQIMERFLLHIYTTRTRVITHVTNDGSFYMFLEKLLFGSDKYRLSLTEEKIMIEHLSKICISF